MHAATESYPSTSNRPALANAGNPADCALASFCPADRVGRWTALLYRRTRPVRFKLSVRLALNMPSTEFSALALIPSSNDKFRAPLSASSLDKRSRCAGHLTLHVIQETAHLMIIADASACRIVHSAMGHGLRTTWMEIASGRRMHGGR